MDVDNLPSVVVRFFELVAEADHFSLEIMRRIWNGFSFFLGCRPTTFRTAASLEKAANGDKCGLRRVQTV